MNSHSSGSYRVPEEAFVELDLKVLFQEAGISSGVSRQFLGGGQQQKLKTIIPTIFNGVFQGKLLT